MVCSARGGASYTTWQSVVEAGTISSNPFAQEAAWTACYHEAAVGEGQRVPHTPLSCSPTMNVVPDGQRARGNWQSAIGLEYRMEHASDVSQLPLSKGACLRLPHTQFD
ncbi:hypothetical protein Bxe_B1093 [Paraburkholderia xenovorans LB400]|uniref:Uncharacterized protein n=1 Tax=Paraburkholderia xenovorans (strain LB400) TaxID=266265 RepID=Q13M27_PARXL|nr:hypothetical protein Bxe_B1093 [Paraburkholderia xenovorans LB400]